MEGWREETFERARNHAPRFGGVLIGQLGYGLDGSVFATNRQSAIKALQFEQLYQRERDVYLRLQSLGVVEVAGFTVPQLVDFDEERWNIVRSVMSRFAAIGIYLADVKPGNITFAD